MPDVDLLEAPVVAKPDATPAPTPTAQPTPTADKGTQVAATGAVLSPVAKGDVTKAPVTSDPAKGKAETDGGDADDLDFEDEAEGDAKPQASWPEDWREKLAGTDDKWLKELKRFTSPETFAKSQRSLRQKLSSGEYKRAAMPENATEDEKAEWRKENQIPDKPEDYGIPEVKGHEWSDVDKTIAQDFLADLHAAGTPKPIADQALKWYAKFQQRQIEGRSELDRQNVAAREDALRAEWGPGDYRPHVTLAREMFQDENFMPAGLREALADARTSQGARLIHNPDFVRFLAQQGLERRGTAGLISGEQGARMTGRADEIRRIMREDYDRYVREDLGAELIQITEKTSGGGRSR